MHLFPIMVSMLGQMYFGYILLLLPFVRVQKIKDLSARCIKTERWIIVNFQDGFLRFVSELLYHCLSLWYEMQSLNLLIRPEHLFLYKIEISSITSHLPTERVKQIYCKFQAEVWRIWQGMFIMLAYGVLIDTPIAWLLPTIIVALINVRAGASQDIHIE